MADLLDELAAADCWCGRSAEECEENGGCRWARELERTRRQAAAAERARAEAMDHSAFLRSAAAALYSDRARIREGAAALAFTLHRPGNGSGEAHGSSMDVVPLAELLALIGGEDG